MDWQDKVVDWIIIIRPVIDRDKKQKWMEWFGQPLDRRQEILTLQQLRV